MTLDQLMKSVDTLKVKKEKTKKYLGRLGAWANGEPLEEKEVVEEPKTHVIAPKTEKPAVKTKKVASKPVLEEKPKLRKLSKEQEKRLAEDEAACKTFAEKGKTITSPVQQDEPEEQKIVKERSATMKKPKMVKPEKVEKVEVEKRPVPMINRCQMCDQAISLVSELKVMKCSSCIELFGE
jgi:hypothetical protein